LFLIGFLLDLAPFLVEEEMNQSKDPSQLNLQMVVPPVLASLELDLVIPKLVGLFQVPPSLLHRLLTCLTSTTVIVSVMVRPT